MTSTSASVARAHASILERTYDLANRQGTDVPRASRLREAHGAVHLFALEIANEGDEERRSMLEAVAAHAMVHLRTAAEMVSAFRSLVDALDARAVAKKSGHRARRDEE